MYEGGRSANIAREMHTNGLQILGLCETRWLQSGKTCLNSGETIIYSGHDEYAQHTDGVAMMLSDQAAHALIGWKPVSSRIMVATFRTCNKRIKLKIIMCYAPTNEADPEAKEEFYGKLQNTIQDRTQRELLILMGDLNAKVGQDNSGYTAIMGKQGVGEMTENGQLFADFCADNNLVIGGTVFPHKEVHKTTWVSPNQQTENQMTIFVSQGSSGDLF